MRGGAPRLAGSEPIARTRRAGGRLAFPLLLGALVAAANAGAQFITPNTGLAVPPPGAARVEVEYSIYRVDEFVDLTGAAQAFPNHLYFNLGVLRASYSPFAHVAIGALLPYRWTSFAESEGEPSLTARGSPGLGVFADWSPADSGSRAPVLGVRVGYFHARTDDNPGVTISDGYSRYTAMVSLASAPAAPDGWHADGSLDLEYAPAAAGQERQIEARLQIAAGRRIARLAGAELRLLALTGYRASRSAVEEDVYFHDLTSRNGFAGFRVEWAPAPPAPDRWAARLSITDDFAPDNAVVGWRATLSFATTL